MKDIETRAYLPIRQLSVYPAEAFVVTHGVNEGDALSDATDLVHDDCYELGKDRSPVRLAVALNDGAITGGDGDKGAGTAHRFSVAKDTGVGQPDAPLFLDSLVTFMTPERATLEALIFVEVEPTSGTIAEVYLYPLDPIDPATPYRLVTIDRENGPRRLAESATVSFTSGTHITMGDGRQMPVEDLRPGDRVLTRDNGVQEVRWVGTQTMRAEGAFAPVVIAEGALNNHRPLTVSPNHRFFIYQRIDAVKPGQRELLVKAGLLINGTTVTQVPGGFVEYVQVLFDRHEIIYAEGIAAESYFIDTTTRPALPKEIAAKLGTERPSDYPLGAVELREGDFNRQRDPAEMLKRVSAI